jgi:hypothetical protein
VIVKVSYWSASVRQAVIDKPPHAIGWRKLTSPAIGWRKKTFIAIGKRIELSG